MSRRNRERRIKNAEEKIRRDQAAQDSQQNSGDDMVGINTANHVLTRIIVIGTILTALAGLYSFPLAVWAGLCTLLIAGVELALFLHSYFSSEWLRALSYAFVGAAAVVMFFIALLIQRKITPSSNVTASAPTSYSSVPSLEPTSAPMRFRLVGELFNNDLGLHLPF